MSTTWIIVANRSGARILESRGSGKDLTLVEDISHPEGRLKSGEIDTDGPGRAFDSGGQGRHAMEPEQSSHDRMAGEFAREIAAKLDGPRSQGRFDRLALVAPPDFLGRLRESLSDATAKLVEASVAKNLTDAPPERVRTELEGQLLV